MPQRFKRVDEQKVDEFDALPAPKKLGELAKKAGASIGQALGNAYHASVGMVRSLSGSLSEDENSYYSSIAPALAEKGKWFLHSGWKKSFVESMEHIPKDEERFNPRYLYIRRVATKLIDHGAIDKKEELVEHAKGFRKLYDAIPEAKDDRRTMGRDTSRTTLMAYGMEYMIGSGIVKKPGDWDKLTDAVGKIENVDAKVAFIGYVLPDMKRSGAMESMDGAEAAAEQFEKCTKEWEWGKENRATWLSSIVKTGKVKSGQDWEDIRETVKGIPKDWLDDRRTRKGYGTLIGNALEGGKSPADVRHELGIIKKYVRKHGDKKMIWKTGADNLEQGIPEPAAFPRTMRFEKDDSGGNTVDNTLLPLSGRATGIFFRKMDPEAYRAWAKAQKAGVPCEQILTRDRFLTKATPQELESMDVRGLAKKLNVKYTQDVAKRAASGDSLRVEERGEEKRVIVSDAGGKDILSLRARRDRDGNFNLSAKSFRAKKTKDGMVRVACKYGGQDLVEFFADESNEKYKPQIEKQVGKLGGPSGLDIVEPNGEIPTKLKELGIRYGPDSHMHPYNFVVEMKDEAPLVRIIDFDHAKIVKK